MTAAARWHRRRLSRRRHCRHLHNHPRPPSASVAAAAASPPPPATATPTSAVVKPPCRCRGQLPVPPTPIRRRGGGGDNERHRRGRRRIGVCGAVAQRVDRSGPRRFGGGAGGLERQSPGLGASTKYGTHSLKHKQPYRESDLHVGPRARLNQVPQASQDHIRHLPPS